MPTSLAKRLTLILGTKGMAKVRRQLGGLKGAVAGVTKGVVALGIAFGVLFGIVGVVGVAAASSFETAFAGIVKTVDDAADSSGKLTKIGEQLRLEIRALALELPVSANELARMGEVAGQLGIKSKDITKFVSVIARLAATTNIVGEEGALQLAKFLNLTKLGVNDLEALGSAIVDLGNNFAAQEAEILFLAKNLAVLNSSVGFSAGEILALATTIEASGGQAQAAATTFQKLGLDMGKAVAQGSDRLADFARVAGMSATKFAEVFREDAFGALQLFLEGINKSLKAGENLGIILETVGIKQSRFTREIGKVAANVEQLGEAFNIQKKAMEGADALQKEFNIRLQTFASQMVLLKNRLIDLAISIGDRLLTPVKELATAFVVLVEKSFDWIKRNPDLIKQLGLITLAIAAIGAILVVATNPFLLIAASILGLLVILNSSEGEIKDWANRVIRLFTAIPIHIRKAFAEMKAIIFNPFKKDLDEAFAEIEGKFAGEFLINSVTDFAGGIKKGLKFATDEVEKGIKALMDKIRSFGKSGKSPVVDAVLGTDEQVQVEIDKFLDTIDVVLNREDIVPPKIFARWRELFGMMRGAAGAFYDTVQAQSKAFFSGESKRLIDFGQLTNQIWRGAAAGALQAIATELRGRAEAWGIKALAATAEGFLGNPAAFKAAAGFAAAAAAAGGAAAVLSGTAAGIQQKAQQQLAGSLGQQAPLTDAERAAGVTRPAGSTGATSRGGVTQLAAQNVTIAPQTTFIAQDGGIVAIGSGGIEEAEENLGSFIVQRVRAALEQGEIQIT